MKRCFSALRAPAFILAVGFFGLGTLYAGKAHAQKGDISCHNFLSRTFFLDDGNREILVNDSELNLSLRLRRLLATLQSFPEAFFVFSITVSANRRKEEPPIIVRVSNPTAQQRLSTQFPTDEIYSRPEFVYERPLFHFRGLPTAVTERRIVEFVLGTLLSEEKRVLRIYADSSGAAIHLRPGTTPEKIFRRTIGFPVPIRFVDDDGSSPLILSNKLESRLTYGEPVLVRLHVYDGDSRNPRLSEDDFLDVVDRLEMLNAQGVEIRSEEHIMGDHGSVGIIILLVPVPQFNAIRVIPRIRFAELSFETGGPNSVKGPNDHRP